MANALQAARSAGAWADCVEGPGRLRPRRASLDRALGRAFARHAVDPARVAVGGFSDGASCALSLGVLDGDPFAGGVLAFSPGFLAPTERRGTPRAFVSHGVRDEVLPIDATSRRLVPLLRRERYEVEYREFEGGHVVPPELVWEAFESYLGT